jgi:hypothetical protein
LGRNAVVEHLTVGRRLAYDQQKGRLWVVCRHCERWNLTPLETRWEAIDEAEQLFRRARLRIATENIALVRLHEGLELVRIGVPPRLELAAWRYGDQFGRRRRRYIALSGLGLAATGLPMLGSLGLAAAVVGLGGTVTHVVFDRRKWWMDARVPTVFLTDDRGAALPLSTHDAWSAALIPIHRSREWYLTVAHRVRGADVIVQRSFRDRRGRGQAQERAMLTKGAAQRALAVLLPHANPAGGSARSVREAVGVIESYSSLDQLLYAAAVTTKSPDILPDRSPITQLPARMRLALEMVLHEEDEGQASQGQLEALEHRWREAEELANIADNLLRPTDVDTRLDALRKERGQSHDA